LKNYYFILEISIYAKEGDIKRAYRKLALLYHPDKNASPNAATIFREINEAYEVLIDPQKKLAYDQMLVGAAPVAVVSEPTSHRDPRYRPKPPGFVSTKTSQRKEMLEWMARNLPGAILLSRFTLCCSLFLFVDFCLPEKNDSQQIKDFEIIYDRQGATGVKIESVNGEQFRVKKEGIASLTKGDTITIRSSAILGVPKRVKSVNENFDSRIRVSIYGNFIFFPFIWIVTSALGAFYKKGVEFRFNLSIVNALLIIFNLIILRISF
jgi:curved DNA-binding protein CbpA